MPKKIYSKGKRDYSKLMKKWFDLLKKSTNVTRKKRKNEPVALMKEMPNSKVNRNEQRERKTPDSGSVYSNFN